VVQRSNEFTNDLTRCVQVEDTKLGCENRNLPRWDMKEPYVGVQFHVALDGWNLPVQLS